MYCSFFGFAEKPFDVTSDPTFLYLTPGGQEVLATLLYGVRERRGFVVLLGEVGTGKTTFLKALLDQFDEKTKVATIFTTDVTFEELLQMVLIELDLKNPDEDVSKAEAFRRLSDFAIHQHSRRGNLVLVIDEAQNLNDRVIENLRLLSNFETRKHKLIQIVLAGQPELESKLNQPQLRQFAQRIALKCQINPLTEKETYAYLEHRLARAGFTGSILFSRKARQMAWEYSGGIPRKINILCDKAFLIAYALRKRRVDKRIIDETTKSLGWKPISGIAETIPPPPYPKKTSQKEFFAKPNFALLGSLIIVACLLFVLFSPHSASFFRSEPEPARFSSPIDRSHLESTKSTIGLVEGAISSAGAQVNEDKTLPKPVSAMKAGQEDRQIDNAGATSSKEGVSPLEAQPEMSIPNAEVGLDNAWELKRDQGIDSEKGDMSSPQQYQGPESTITVADAVLRKTEAINAGKVILQVGAYQEQAIALHTMNNLLKEGYDAHLETKYFRDGRIFYRVQLHCSQNKNEVRGMLAKLRKRGFENAFIAQGGKG